MCSSLFMSASGFRDIESPTPQLAIEMDGEQYGSCTCSDDLFEAAEKGCEVCCRRMVSQAGKTRDDIQLEWHIKKNRTTLMVAAFYGKTECVRILAEKEAKMQDGYNETALMFAAEKGHLECVEILAPLEKGMKNRVG